jgi:hypothetical protein
MHKSICKLKHCAQQEEEWRLNRSTAPDPEHLSSPECLIVLSHQHMLSKTLVVLELSLPSFDSTNKKHNVSIQNHFLFACQHRERSRRRRRLTHRKRSALHAKQTSQSTLKNTLGFQVLPRAFSTRKPHLIEADIGFSWNWECEVSFCGM